MRFILCAVMALLFVGQAQAETLEAALTRAYTNSASINKERARLRVVDEQVPLAKSGARPSADLTANAGYTTTDIAGRQTDTKPRGFGLSVSQPLYKGGQIDAQIGAAESAVLAQRALLHNAEQDLFIRVVTAYVDVARDQEVLRLNRKNEEVLRQELQAARDRQKVGEATRTDTAQAESRYSKATADRIQSEGTLAISRAAYQRVTRREPSDLKIPKANFSLPATMEEGIKQAQEQHPSIIAARFAETGAEHDVDAATGALLPEIKLEASAGKNWEPSSTVTGEVDSSQVMARFTMPIYRAGADYAKTRAAKETASVRRIEIREAMNAARENMVRAWETWLTSKATITARQKQVEAAALAYEGVKQESQVGTRTVLDRLDAEAESLQARVNLVQAQRDYTLAMFDVKAAVGDLTAEKLKLPVTPYDAEAHYNEVKDAWIGIEGGFDGNTETENPAPVEPEGDAALLPEERKK